MNKENVILCSLWCGPQKPPIHTLLKPLVRTLEKLATIGTTLHTPVGTKTIRGKLLLGVFDMPAKALVLNTKQFNGEYGCSTCLHLGVHKNGSRIYLPLECEMRTNTMMLQCAEKAVKRATPVLGVKGYSALSPVMDLVDLVPVDYMHAVLEGMTRWLLHRWFDSKHHAEPYYLGCHLKSIDQALLHQRPPHELSRSPWSIH